jgi:hypothetical protein
MAFFNADTTYGPGRVTTSANTGGINLPAAPKNQSLQLLALLGPGMATRQKMAELQMQKMKQDMLMQREQGQMAERAEQAQRLAANNARLQAAQGRKEVEPTTEASYVKQMGGPNTVPGLVRTYGGDPGAVFGGMWQKGSGPRGATSFETTPAPGQQASQARMIQLAALQKEQELQEPQEQGNERADWYGLRGTR